MSRLDGVAPPTKGRKFSKAELEGAARFLELLVDHGVDVDDLFREGYTPSRITGGTHETGMKVRDEDGTDRIEVVEQKRGGFELRLAPSWAAGPQWPLVQPGPEIKVSPAKVSKRGTKAASKTLVCLPDMQLPFGDRDAIDVSLQIVAATSPDVIVLLGDNIDAPGLSRFRQRPEFATTLQSAIDEMTVLCAELRATAPNAEIVWLAGNHDERLTNYILDNAAAAYGVRPGKLPDEDPQRPVLTVPSLCRLEDTGVTYVGGYPAGTYWFGDVRFIHGRYSGAQAVKKHLDEGVSSVFGHVHHRLWGERVLADGRHIFAISPGCLCDVTGGTPGTMSGWDDGPVRQPVDWQQGVLVGDLDPDGRFWPELVPIHQGTAVFRGEHLTSS